MQPRARRDITAKNVDQLFHTTSFRDLCARRLADAVKVETITYDGMGHVGDDARWEIFYRFSELLKRSFPRV